MGKLKLFSTISKITIAYIAVYVTATGFVSAQSLIDDTGSPNSYIIVYPANFSGLTPPAGFMVTFRALNDNTGASTLKLNSYTDYLIKKNGSTDLSSNDIKANSFVTVIFDGTNNWWQMLSVPSNPIGNVTSGGSIGFIPRFVNANAILNSTIQSDGSWVSIGNIPQNNYLFRVDQNTSNFPAIYGQNSFTDGVGIWGNSNNNSPNAVGVRGVATGQGRAVFADNTNAAGYALAANGKGYFIGNLGIGTSNPGTITGAAKYLTLAHGEAYTGSQTTSFEMVGSRNALNAEYTKIDLINFNSPIPTIVNSARISAFSGNGAVSHGQLVFYTNNGTLTEKMRLSEAGRLGIGLNPSANLAQLQVTDLANTAGQIRVWAGTATGETGTDGLLISSAASGVSFQNYENAPMQFGSGGAAIQMTLSQAGNLGLKTGVSTPFNKLSIDGNASIGTNYYSLTAAANSLIVEGKIGIGVVNPDSPLQVEQTNNWAEGKFYTYHTGGTNYSAIILGRANGTQTIPTATQASNILGAVVFRGAHGAGIWQVEASQIYALAEENFASATNGGASILFSTVAIGTSVSSERMRLFHNGNLGIGATAPPSLLTVGSGNQFQINATGNILRINSVATNFPNAQGGANTFLRNDGGGNLSWVVSGGISQWTTSGSNIYYNTGNVGIGTSIPGVRLDVVGTTNIQAGKITKDGFDWLDGQPGNRNYFIGQAGNLGITGTDNFLVGSFAGNAMTTGFDNTFIGRQAGRTNTTGRSNFFVGTLSGFTNLSGNRNIFIGEGTGFTNSTGTQNIYMGWQTGFFNLGSSNIYMGSQAGYGAVGSNNTNNIGFGPAALYSITSGAANIVLGYQAAFSLTTGIANIAIGSNSGSNFGTSNNNIAIGTNADVISPASNGIAIGTGASVTTSNTMVIAPSITAVGIGTATPKTKLDVDGDVAFRLKTYTATNGANNNIVLPAGATYVKIIGPAAVFNISGIAGGQDGKLVILHNATTSNMTINHQITSTAANRIITNTGADLVTTGEGMAILIYDNLSFRWIVLAFTP